MMHSLLVLRPQRRHPAYLLALPLALAIVIGFFVGLVPLLSSGVQQEINDGKLGTILGFVAGSAIWCSAQLSWYGWCGTQPSRDHHQI